jgi:hypothetical protein
MAPPIAALNYTSVIPAGFAYNFVNATSQASDGSAYNAFNPSKSLLGTNAYTSYSSTPLSSTNQRIHIKLPQSVIIRNINYSNFHSCGSYTDWGIKNFTLWGSELEESFISGNNLLYTNDTGWTPIALTKMSFDRHEELNTEDLKNIIVSNVISYQYYCIKAENTWDATALGLGIRRIELQTEDDLIVLLPAPILNPSTDRRYDFVAIIKVWWWLPVLIFGMIYIFGGKK